MYSTLGLSRGLNMNLVSKDKPHHSIKQNGCHGHPFVESTNTKYNWIRIKIKLENMHKLILSFPRMHMHMHNK